MLSIVLGIAMILWSSLAYGQLIKEKLNFNVKFTAPIGFAGLLLTVQLFYYPIQYFNLNSRWLMGISLIVMLALFVYSVTRFRKIISQFLDIRMLWVALSFALFLFLFYNVSIFMMYADTQMYLNYIAQNVNNTRVNDFLLWTGLTGVEFDAIYLFQGYFHFIASIIQILNLVKVSLGSAPVDNIIISIWVMAPIYSLVSSFLILEFVDYFKYKHRWIQFVVTFFAIFYTNYHYWKVSYAFYGNTWRSLFMAFLMYTLYRWIHEQNSNYKYIAAIVFGASLAASSSSLFIGFAILLGFGFVLFKNKEKNILENLSIIAIPMVIYVLAIVSKDYFNVSIILLFAPLLFYSQFFIKPIHNAVQTIDGFISKHARLIFLIILPLIAIIYSLIYPLIDPNFPYGFNHYFQNHAGYDMVKDYLFLHSKGIDIALNIIRWSAVLVLILFERKKAVSSYFLNHLLLIMVFFLNPLTTTFISKMFASNVYYRAFESIFNAFSEVMLFTYLLNYLSNKKLLVGLCSLTLIFTVFYEHYRSYILHDRSSLYGFAAEEGQTVMPLYKITYNEYDTIQEFQNILSNTKQNQNNQLTIVSHVNGVRTFVPDAYQLFTARQYWYNWDRVDQTFYQIAWRKFPWDESSNLDYAKSCTYLKQFKVDYILNETIYNSEFDKATDSCTETLFYNGEFKIKKVK